MPSLIWLGGLIRRRPARLLATIVGVAVAVSLIASIGTFLSATNGRMTQRAIARVPVDWQVQVDQGHDPSGVLSRVRALPQVTHTSRVGIASATGLRSSSGGSVQSTGPGKVIGIGADYARAFPGELRTLAGSGHGVLLAQQTAANLHARPGDRVLIGRQGMSAVALRIDGIVDLPAADSLFQRVGAPQGAQPQAPPDNVVLLPSATFRHVEGPLGAARPDLVRTQIHAALDRQLPSSPDAAFKSVSGQARNLEVKLAGAGLVGDNLGAALDQARGDALYAQLLFLFLGLPGVALAAVVTASVAAAGADRRRRDAALLRTRGSTTGSLVRIALAEATVAGVAGSAIGLASAAGLGKLSFGTTTFGAGTLSSLLWAAGAALAGAVVAAVAIVLPAWRDARGLTVAGQRRQLGRAERRPLWSRLNLDVAALAVAGLVFWQSSRNGYDLVLAPEGVPQVSVNRYALLAPLLAWVGAGLLTYRLTELALRRGRGPLKRVLRPLAGELSPTVAASMSRQRRTIARSVALVALSIAFAGSTAVFNSTYRQQSEVDARLTNGADVTVTESPGSAVSPSAAAPLARVRGVRSVEPLQHRFAYVGADLQDLYGVRPQTIGRAASLQDAWFAGGGANQLMRRLTAKPDSVLVSAETVKDFQLHAGDPLRLRLQNTRTHRFVTVAFHYAGVAKEFPTAPSDSFLVANAAYVARQTHSAAIGSLLVDTAGRSPGAVARDVRAVVGTQASVTDISSSRRVVGSNLTAVELAGLTRVELGFGLLLAIASSGLVLGLGLSERRRTFAIAAALGATPRQLAGFISGEALFLTTAGVALGALITAGLSTLLTKLLTGVFDPPPDTLALPWAYLVGVIAATAGSVGLAGRTVLSGLREPNPDRLREL